MSLAFLLFLFVFVFLFVILYRDLEISNNLEVLLPLIIAVASFFVGSYLFMFPLSGALAGFWGWKIYKFVLHKKKQHLKNTIIKQCQDLIAMAAGMFGSGKNTDDVIRAAAENIANRLGADLERMIDQRDFAKKQYPELFKELEKKYEVPEFGAIAAILELGRTGGPAAISNGFSRLSGAIRRKNRIAAERAKAMSEPTMVAGITMGLLLLGLLVDITLFRDIFAGSVLARVTLFMGMLIITGMMYLIKVISNNADLGI